jgi:hypothetical protein
VWKNIYLRLKTPPIKFYCSVTTFLGDGREEKFETVSFKVMVPFSLGHEIFLLLFLPGIIFAINLLFQGHYFKTLG